MNINLLLNYNRKNYTGYSLESRLHFRIHAELMDLTSKLSSPKLPNVNAIDLNDDLSGQSKQEITASDIKLKHSSSTKSLKNKILNNS